MFEYLILPADGFVPVEALNNLGKDDWELVSIVSNSDGSSYDYVFKRFIGPSERAMNIINNQRKITVKPSITPPPTISNVMEAFDNAYKV